MSGYELAIFPEETLAASVTTTVWIGVFVVVFFNLRLGWPLTGLVVPGYIVPLLIAKPMSAGVICVEAVITYWLVRLLSERANGLSCWCSLFGRDRFFALVVVSVLVRALMDGWFLPWLGPRVNDLLGINLDYRNHLHSYGLIIVALLANYFWKPGLLRGIVPITVTIGTTFLLVRFVLIEYTNFNVGILQYMYDDIASSLLASPKAYVILLTTALLASWVNLRYGWEFNGILIPALLALQWYAPLKILASFSEAVVILLLATLVLKLPCWRSTTMEGGRKILLFFNLSFLYRLVIGWVAPKYLPSINVTDLYGFGYLLSTLLAIRAHDGKMAVRLINASFQVSLVGAVAGSVFGFLLLSVPAPWLYASQDTAAGTVPEPVVLGGRLVDILRADKIALYEKKLPDSYSAPFGRDIEIFSAAVRQLDAYVRERKPERLDDARRRLDLLGYSVHLVQDRYLYLHQREPRRGWGVYVFDLHQPEGMLVSIPAPLDEWATLAAGIDLFQRLPAGALAVAGASQRTNRDGSANVLRVPQTIFAIFHRVLGQRVTLQVRAGGGESLGARSKAERRAKPDAPQRAVSRLRIALDGRLSPGLQLPKIEQLVPNCTVTLAGARMGNVLRDNAREDFAELFLSRADRMALLTALDAEPGRATGARCQRVDGSLNSFLLARKEAVAARGTDQYVPARFEQLRYLDDEVLRPVLGLAQKIRSFADLDQPAEQELTAAASAAGALQYQLTLLHDPDLGEDFFVLSECEPPPRHWGTYVFRCGLRDAFVVGVPRPLYERQAWEFGLALFQRPRAAALLLAGAHPWANVNGSADMARLANKVNLYNLVHQVLMRQLGATPALVIETRAVRAPVDADVMVATSDGSACREQLAPLARTLIDRLEQDGLTIRFADGSPLTAGYDLGNTLRLVSLNQAENKELVSVWLSPSLRTNFRQHTANTLQAAQFHALGIITLQGDLCRRLQDSAPDWITADIPGPLRDDATAYLYSEDIVQLRRLQRRWPDYRLTRFIDRNSRQAFLLIAPVDSAKLPLVANLAGTPRAEPQRFVAHGLAPDQVRLFIDSRATWLEVLQAP